MNLFWVFKLSGAPPLLSYFVGRAEEVPGCKVALKVASQGDEYFG